jgi:hypothetical protein
MNKNIGPKFTCSVCKDILVCQTRQEFPVVGCDFKEKSLVLSQHTRDVLYRTFKQERELQKMTSRNFCKVCLNELNKGTVKGLANNFCANCNDPIIIVGDKNEFFRTFCRVCDTIKLQLDKDCLNDTFCINCGRVVESGSGTPKEPSEQMFFSKNPSDLRIPQSIDGQYSNGMFMESDITEKQAAELSLALCEAFDEKITIEFEGGTVTADYTKEGRLKKLGPVNDQSLKVERLDGYVVDIKHPVDEAARMRVKNSGLHAFLMRTSPTSKSYLVVETEAFVSTLKVGQNITVSGYRWQELPDLYVMFVSTNAVKDPADIFSVLARLAGKD